MKNRNIECLTCFDVAEELADKCFTPEQKTTLEYQQGQIKITIADQLNKLYGENLLTWNKEHTIKFFALKVKEYEHLIKDIERGQILIERIKDPGNMAKVTETENNTATTSGISSDSNTISVGYNASQTYQDSEAKTIARTLNSEPTELITTTDLNDERVLLGEIKRGLLKHKESNFLSPVYKEIINKLEITDPEWTPNIYWTPEEEEALGILKTETIKYHNTQLNRSANINNYRTQGETGNTNAGDTKNSTESVSCVGGFNTSTVSIKADDNLRALEIEIPLLRDRFWNKFKELFSDIDYRYYR